MPSHLLVKAVALLWLELRLLLLRGLHNFTATTDIITSSNRGIELSCTTHGAVVSLLLR